MIVATAMISIPRRLRRAVLCGVVSVQQCQIARLRLEREIEQVTGNRHHADERIERDIAEHVQPNCRRRIQVPCNMHRVHRHQRAGDVADTRHEPEQGIEAESPFRAGNGERLVEELGDCPQAIERTPAAFLVATLSPATIDARVHYSLAPTSVEISASSAGLKRCGSSIVRKCPSPASVTARNFGSTLRMRVSFTGSPRSELIKTMGTEMSLSGCVKSYSSSARNEATPTRGGESDMS